MFGKYFTLWALLLFVFCCLGCALSKKSETAIFSLDEISCQAGFIRGSGIGESEQQAMAKARADISSQIKLSMVVASELYEKQFLSENKESFEVEFNSKMKQTTELLNAQDAKLQATKKAGNEIGVVACMSREDAAKPYLSDLQQANDSLSIAIKTALAQDHPRTKKEAVKAAENLRMRQIMAVQVLQGLGKNVKLQENESYGEMINNYGEFSSKFKFIWLGENEQISQVLMSKISSRYKIETGTCTHGLKLIPISLEVHCENNSSYGPQCSYLPAMEGRSCTDELYFTLRGQMVRGTGINDYNDAMRKLLALIPNAPFWQKWFEELDKYK
ncbi:MAG: LPP20 family lipoprotein [Fibromonadales bacterium]|nr:LPP20 family lipoprotein [Fibromonadales bacterium]